MDTPEVVHDVDGQRFFVETDDAVAELIIREHGDRLVLVHTEVPEELGGRGLASALVIAALDHAATHGLVVVPRCPFARQWLEAHSDAAARATIDWER